MFVTYGTATSIQIHHHRQLSLPDRLQPRFFKLHEMQVIPLAPFLGAPVIWMHRPPLSAQSEHGEAHTAGRPLLCRPPAFFKVSYIVETLSQYVFRSILECAWNRCASREVTALVLNAASVWTILAITTGINVRVYSREPRTHMRRTLRYPQAVVCNRLWTRPSENVQIRLRELSSVPVFA